MKVCPFCAEEIQDAAIVCKHCGRDLPSATSTPSPLLPAPSATPDPRPLPVANVAAYKHRKTGLILAGLGFLLTLSSTTAGFGIVLLWVGCALSLPGGLVMKVVGGFLLAAVVAGIGGALSGSTASSSARSARSASAAPTPTASRAETDKASSAPTPTASRAETEQPLSAPQPAERVDAGQLIRAYTDNEIAADARFKGESFEITGVVDRIGKDILNSPYVTLGTGADVEFRNVQCMLAKNNRTTLELAGDLRKGERLTVFGRVDGLMMNVLVRDCVIR